MQDLSPESPEARARRRARMLALVGRDPTARTDLLGHAWDVLKRVAVGVYSDGFIHAGNLAYLALLTLFPFFIAAAAIARLFGRTGDGLATVNAFLQTVPPDVAELLAKPIADVLAARSGNLLWLGAIVGIWTTGSLIETIRDILRRAYGVRYSRPFWEYRLGSMGMTIAAVILAMIAFSFQVVMIAVEQFFTRVIPNAADADMVFILSRLGPALALFGAIYVLFYSLTPSKYRVAGCPKAPGAFFTTIWWLGTTELLPAVLASLGGYDLTYGSLAGVMIALIFFFIVGLGVVIGAELNAALAETPDTPLKDADNEEGPTAWRV